MAKYDSLGNYLWDFRIGGKGYDEGYKISVDINYDIIISGWFRDSAYFDPPHNTVKLGASSIWLSEGFFAKYDSEGNYIWAKQIGVNVTLGEVFKNSVELYLHWILLLNINSPTKTGYQLYFKAWKNETALSSNQSW